MPPPKQWPFILATLFVAVSSSCSTRSTGDATPIPGQQAPLTRPPTPILPTPYPSPKPSATFEIPEATATPVSTPTVTQASAACAEKGETVIGSYLSQVTGLVHRYRVYLPPCYDDNGPAYPALYIFHGSAQNDSHWDNLGLDEAAEQAILIGEIPPLLIIMPDGGQIAQSTSGGAGSFEQLILTDLLPHVESSYCVWPEAEGRAIGGLSRGGYWALEIAFRNPSEFAAVGGHSAALLDVAAGPAVNPQTTALTGNLLNLRIYLDIGRDDWVFENTYRLHEDMVAAGIPHVWRLNEGGHNDAYWSAHAPEYLRWYAESWPADRNHYPSCRPPGE